jgi:hypothetical protein
VGNLKQAKTPSINLYTSRVRGGHFTPLKQLVAVVGLVTLPNLIFGQERPEPEYLNVAYVYDSASNKLISLERQNASPAAKVKAFGTGGIKSTFEVPAIKSQVRFPSDQKLAFVFKAPPGLDPQISGRDRSTHPQEGPPRNPADAIQGLYGARRRQERSG